MEANASHKNNSIMEYTGPLAFDERSFLLVFYLHGAIN
jgi:hypothetical protein